MAPYLYLHERVDIVGEQAASYMRNSVHAVRSELADLGVGLLGTWSVVGSTGRWPQVVNVWELPGGWDDWGRLCRSTGLHPESATDGDAVALWPEATQRRTGGSDRLLEAVPGCPTLDELSEEGVRGGLFVHETTAVRPGAGRDYLAAVAAGWVPLAQQYGMLAVGLWEVLLSDTEVVTLWATTIEAQVAYRKAVTAGEDERLVAWRTQARSWTTVWHEELLVPGPGTPLGAIESDGELPHRREVPADEPAVSRGRRRRGGR